MSAAAGARPPSAMHRFLARRARVPVAAALYAQPRALGRQQQHRSCFAASTPPSRGRRRPPPAAAAASEAAAETATAADPSSSSPSSPRNKPNNFDVEAERQAAIDAAREAFRATREAALEKNAALAAKLKGKLILAPLTRGGNLPFRRLCADFGADAAVSEMVFARSLVGRGGGGKGASLAEKTRLRRAPNEPLFGVQIACKEIREGGAALRLAAEAGADYASLNCGCPIHEATRRGLGASLLKKPTKLARLVAGLVAESPLPLEVKIRTGPGEANVNAPFVAALLEAAGAAAVTIHGRTMEQRYRKAADWDIIHNVAAQRRADAATTGLPPVPIIGNGDFLTWYEVERRGVFLGGGGNDAAAASNAAADDSSAIHAAMIGRGALVKPWIWQECRERRELFLTPEDRVGVYRQLVAHMKAYFGDDAKGRGKSFYFLPWHFNFFHRYRPFPKEEYEDLSLNQPLLSTRVTLWDKGKEAEGAEGVPPLERLLRCENERAFEEIAGVLWDAGSDAEAVTGLERLSTEKVREWERELYEKEQAGRWDRGDGGRGGGGAAGASSEEEEDREVSG